MNFVLTADLDWASAEPLETVSREFIGCIMTGRRSITDGEAGLRVIEVLETAHMSLKNGGALTYLPHSGVVQW